MAKERKAVAKHDLIDAAGTVVETEELATGVRYTLLAGGEPLDWQSKMKPGKPATMVWCFGAKTLITNISSQSRQAGRTSVSEQLEDIAARRDLIESGTWVDRTREAFKPDLDLLVDAFAQYATDLGKVTAEQVAAELRAKWRTRADDDAQWVKDAYGIAAVKENYARLAGRPIKTVDDLM